MIFAGTTKEPWDAYRRADVVAMASISEGFPYTLVEAMLCGAAIVATDVGGVGEALGSTGVLVTPRDPAELAAALIGLLLSERRRRQLGAEARARALENFTEVQFVDAHRESYGLLADRGLRRARPHLSRWSGRFRGRNAAPRLACRMPRTLPARGATLQNCSGQRTISSSRPRCCEDGGRRAAIETIVPVSRHMIEEWEETIERGLKRPEER